MRKAADVRSIDALKEAKAAVVEFREVVGVALAEAQSEVQRTLWWLQHDRTTYWHHEVRRRTEKLNQAKSELYRAQLSAAQDRNSCFDQKRAVAKATHDLEEAKRKVELVKKWSRAMDRELMLFKGKLQPIARAVEGDLPRAEARLELLLDRLDAYVKLAAPPSMPPRGAASGSAPGAADHPSSPGRDDAPAS
jgi:hypothetical protein